MATVRQQMKTVSEALNEVFEGMGDLSGKTVTVIDQMLGEPNGNERVARLLEVFNNGDNVTIVTADLGMDSREQETLVGKDAFKTVTGGALASKFKAVNYTGLRHGMLQDIAHEMIDECNLNRTMQLGLKTIVMDDLAQGKVRVSDGVGSLRHHVDSYLRRELTAEWRETLMEKSPYTAAIRHMGEGMKCEVEAPNRATFPKKDKTF